MGAREFEVESPAILMDPSSSSSGGSNPYQVNIKIMIAAIVVLFSVILFILSLHLYAKWFWKSSQFAARRRRLLQLQQIHAIQQQIQAAEMDPQFFANAPAELGLDKAIIDALPLFVFRDSQIHCEGERDGGGDLLKLDCCAVCLCEFQEGERGRSLPKCGHSFHTQCIDMWLHCHSTCPLCRTSLLDASGITELPKVPELLLALVQDLNLAVATASIATNAISSSSSSTASTSSSSSSSSSSALSPPSSTPPSRSSSFVSTSSTSGVGDSQLVQVVLDLDNNVAVKSIASSSTSCGSSSSAKGRWRNLRRMLGKISSSSSSSSSALPSASTAASLPSSFCSFSSSSSTEGDSPALDLQARWIYRVQSR